jgi:hypothetical protein
VKHEEPKYIRKGRVVREVGSKAETFKSISQAKRRSLELQKANGGRGCGYVRVER